MEEWMFEGRVFAAFLFDMDGTLLDSIAVANRVWADWARGHGLDPDEVLRVMHGVQVRETVRRFAGPDWDIEAEARALTEAELADVDGIVEIRGASQFLSSLPTDRWAIVTSAGRELALRRIAAVGLPMPGVVITADEIERGKPSPDCFIAAAERLGVAADQCLIWEDAPAGIAAGEATGGKVCVISATHQEPHDTGHPTLADYRGVEVRVAPDGFLRLAMRVAGA